MSTKEKINIADYATHFAKAVTKGILLNTNGEKFNSMVIGWANIGTTWNMPTIVVYVRQNRYTKAQIDATGEFSISIPQNSPDPEINKICGWQSGRDIDKVKEAGLTLDEPDVIKTPGIKEYPITLECEVVHSQPLELDKLPDEIREKMYPQDVDSTYPMANRDAHTVYIAKIVSAYVIK